MPFRKLIAGLSIQSKVLVFVVPLIGGIIGLAVINQYSGALLSRGLGGTSASIASLSGFKKAYGEMNAFLATATGERRDAVMAELEDQLARLEASRAFAGTDAERSALETARGTVTELQAQTARLWEIQETERQLGAAIESDIAKLVGARLLLINNTLRVRREAKETEQQAKARLLAANGLYESADLITEYVRELNKVEDAQAMLALISRRAGDYAKLRESVQSGFPDGKQPLKEAIVDNLSAIAGLAASRVAGDAILVTAQRHANALRPAGVQLRGLAMRDAREATARLAEIDKATAYAELVATGAQDILDSINAVQLSATRLLGTKSGTAKDELVIKLNLLASSLGKYAKTVGDDADALAPVENIRPLLASLHENAGGLVNAFKARQAAFDDAAARIDDAWANIVAFAGSQSSGAAAAQDDARTVSVFSAVFFTLFGVLASMLLVAALKGPIRRLTLAMSEVASGNLSAEVRGVDRGDEIGEMARALAVFRNNAIDKIRVEREGEQARAAAARERETADRQRVAAQGELQQAVAAIGASLDRLAGGDLTATVDTPLAGELDRLRLNLNTSMERMRETLLHIRDNARSIDRRSTQLHAAADNLSRRTENQASAIEEAASAIEQISSTVTAGSERMATTDRLAGEARRDSADASATASDAAEAMSRIEQQAEQISRIITVIDEIAFQTNLLALNAGVEAARAGEAGHGFAVVAQEVRELATRSASAAKEIKGLIVRSGEEVRAGVGLVSRTVETIARVTERIDEIANQVAALAGAGAEQADGLREISSTVGQLDRDTQQNTAMAEETTTATDELLHDVRALSGRIAAFRLEADAGPAMRDVA
ncbi:MAG: methyl-accepting chemotaxis protein [Oricola sp.]